MRESRIGIRETKVVMVPGTVPAGTPLEQTMYKALGAFGVGPAAPHYEHPPMRGGTPGVKKQTVKEETQQAKPETGKTLPQLLAGKVPLVMLDITPNAWGILIK